jgi:hypothetical protein
MGIKNFIFSMILFLAIVVLAKSIYVNSLAGLIFGSFLCGIYTEFVSKGKRGK